LKSRCYRPFSGLFNNVFFIRLKWLPLRAKTGVERAGGASLPEREPPQQQAHVVEQVLQFTSAAVV